MNELVNFFISMFSFLTDSSFGKEILIFIISMMPVLELRGGILAAALLDMNPIKSYIICVLGNILVIPISLYLLEIVFKVLRKIKFFDKIISKIESHCINKREQFDKYGYLGLLIFVGIPLPGTGAWTGCFLASLLNFDKKKSFLAATLGVIMASIIMMLLSFGIIKNVF